MLALIDVVIDTPKILVSIRLGVQRIWVEAVGRRSHRYEFQKILRRDVQLRRGNLISLERLHSARIEKLGPCAGPVTAPLRRGGDDGRRGGWARPRFGALPGAEEEEPVAPDRATEG